MRVRNLTLAATFCAAYLTAADMTDNDGDGLPDVWEAYFGLSTNIATGADGPFGDPDNDGLSNYAEYLAGYWDIGGNIYSNSPVAVPGLSPTNAHSITAGVLDAYIRPEGTNDCLRFIYTDGDYCDDSWEMSNGLTSIELYDDLREIWYGTMWKYCRSQFFSAPISLGVNMTYYGSVGHGSTNRIYLELHKLPTMPSLAAYKTSFVNDGHWERVKAFSIDDEDDLTSIAGDVYALAYMDLDGNGNWDEGEPLGISDEYPGAVGFGENIINITLTDRPRHGLRMAIAFSNEVRRVLTVKRTAIDGFVDPAAPEVISITKSPAQPLITEADWVGRDVYGVSPWIGIDNPQNWTSVTHGIYEDGSEVAVFTNRFSAGALPVPVQIWPLTNAISTARKIPLRWRITPEPEYPEYGAEVIDAPSGFKIELSNNVEVVHSEVIRQAAQNNLGEYSYVPNVVPTNGMYSWRIRMYTDRHYDDTVTGSGAPGWSAWQPFYVGTDAQTMRFIPPIVGRADITLYYAGKDFDGEFCVAVHRSAAFNDAPVFLSAVTYAPDITNMTAGIAITATQIPAGTYYAVAWKDADGDRERDDEEPWGYYNWLGTADKIPFDARPVVIPAIGPPPAVHVIVEDLPPTNRR